MSVRQLGAPTLLLALAVAVAVAVALPATVEGQARMVVALPGGAAAASVQRAVATPDAAPLRWWRTTADAVERVAVQVPAMPSNNAPGDVVVRVDLGRRYQRITGFGAALTDASALLVAALPPARRDSLWRSLFARGDGGTGLSVLRVPIGASDFSVRHYTYDDVPPGETDSALAHFSMAAEPAARMPLLRAARALNPDLRVVLAPWSAPAWMKTSGSLIGGTLKDDQQAAYARYLVEAVLAYRAAGVPVAALSVQNEPAFTPPDYPGMRLTAAQRAALVAQHLGPSLARAAPGVQLLEWDHNWDQPGEPLAVLHDPAARRWIAGVAWHCYAGNVTAQDSVHRAFPQVATWFTECAGGQWAPKFADNLRWNMATLVVGALRHWATAVVWWNLALDLDGGPHLGGCGNCRGVLAVDTLTGIVTPNVEFDVLAHASRVLRPGSVRVASDDRPGGIRSVAVVHPDGGRGIVILNEGTADAIIALREGARTWRLAVPAGAVVSATWGPRRG